VQRDISQQQVKSRGRSGRFNRSARHARQQKSAGFNPASFQTQLQI